MSEPEIDLEDVQYRYLQLLVDSGCTLKWKFEVMGKWYVWLVTDQGHWFAERLP